MIKKFLGLSVFFLILPLVFGVSSSSETFFNNEFNLPYCISEGPIGGWMERVGSLYSLTTWDSPGYNCHRNAVESGTLDCCPTGESCVGGVCVPSSITCESYLNRDSCLEEDSHPDVASAQLGSLERCDYEGNYGDLCTEYISCACFWDGTSCMAKSNYTITKGTAIYEFPFSEDMQSLCDAEQPPQGGLCTWDTNFVDNCENINKKTVSWTATWTGTNPAPESCVSGFKTVSCISGALLSFFNTINLVIVIILIIIFYIVIRKKKAYKSKKAR